MRLHLVSRDGAKDRVLLQETRAQMGRLSPNSRRVLYAGPDPQRKGDRLAAALFVLDIASGQSKRLEDQPLNGDLMGYCWSPDGRRIAYSWRNREATGGRFESHLVLADPDGRNQVTIATETGQSSGEITIGVDDWR